MKHSIVNVATYTAATTGKAVSEHFAELLAKTTKLVEVGDGSIISIRNKAGLSRHALPIMISPEDSRNTYDKNLFFLDTFGLKDNEADFMYTATVLSAIWEDPTINESYNSVNRLALQLYIQWIGNGYSRQFGLDAMESDNVKVVAGLYYLLQYQKVEVSKFASDDIYRIMTQIAEAIGGTMSPKTVREIIDKYDLLEDIQSLNFVWFRETLRKVSDILHYRMNNTTALTAISNSWYRGMVAQPQLALSYRPFFIAMLYTAFTDRSVHRTGFDNMIKNVLEGRRRQQADTFVGAIDAIMREQIKK